MRLQAISADPRLQRLLHDALANDSTEIIAVGVGSNALTILAEEEPDLVLLDLGQAGEIGIELCRHAREWSDVPIIALGPMDRLDALVDALAVGADDYVAKPFHVRELEARIAAVLRRMRGRASTPRLLTVGDLTIDLARREVRRREELCVLTKTEFELLRELAIHCDQVLIYEHLLEAVWGSGAENVHLLQVHVGNLHRKLRRGAANPAVIVAHPGVGYRLPAQVKKPAPMAGFNGDVPGITDRGD